MTSPDISSSMDNRNQRFLEVLVPLLSFGVTGIGILLWQQGVALNYQYFSIGCIVSSCILAYLAWIRPHKDIVAISTPVYAVIFFFVPAEDVSWILLQLLYAASLTALLLRLKYRFGGNAPVKRQEDDAGPLGEYVEKTGRALAVSPAIADDAGTVFIWFTRGEYDAARDLAESRSKEGEGTVQRPVVLAFSIVAEQSSHILAGIGAAEQFQTFSPDESAVLFHPPTEGRSVEQDYLRTLDNALLLLYALAMSRGSAGRREDVGSYKKFAQKLSQG